MDENRVTLSIAANLVPIVQYLHKAGILSIDGEARYGSGVLITTALFRKVWPDVEPTGHYYLAEFAGVEFRATAGGKADE